MQALVDTDRGAREPVSGIYVDPEIDAHAARHRAEEVLGVARLLAKGVDAGVLGHLTDAVASALPVGRVAGDHLTEVAPTYLAADVVLPRPSALLATGGDSASKVLLWITHELPWLYPDDPRLWGALRAARRGNAHLAVFARKIAPAAFAVFKALGVRGTQYYATLVDGVARETLTGVAEAIGWAPVRAPADLYQSPALQQLGASVTALGAGDARPAQAPNAEQAIESALAREFDTPGGATSEALLVWADDAELAMPVAWREGVVRWERGPAAAPRPRTTAPRPAKPTDHPKEEASDWEPDESTHRAGSRAEDGQVNESVSETVVNRIRVAAEVSREEWVRLTNRRRGTD